MHIKPATEQDLPRIVDIYNASIPSRIATADTTPVTVEDKRGWFNAHTSARPLYIYEQDDKVIGWVSFESFYGRPAYHGTAEISFYVDPAFAKQGIGHKMLTYCIEQCSTLAIQNILGFIFSHNIPSLTSTSP